MKKFFKFLYSTKFILLITFLLNVAFFLGFLFLFDKYVYTFISLICVAIALVVITASNDGKYYKITWILLIFVLPMFGTALYCYLKANHGSKRKRKVWQNINYKSSQYLQPNQQVLDELEKSGREQLKQSNYIMNVTNMPVYQNTTTKFLPDGEAYFNALFDELKKAEKFIFLEYFILEQGKLWDELFQILKVKARQGVEIKLIYDDWGCIDRFKDSKLFRKLANFKIDAVAFNKITPALNAFVNYRDHRKIVVIDGKVGFTGGMNVADEYANIKQRFGTWKDTGVMLTGEAVWSLTVLFLNNWAFATKKDVDYEKYRTTLVCKRKSNEWVQPFGTGPLHNEPCARNIYINMVNNAKKYIYITTPYFIVDDETIGALKLASKSGVDVRIIFPGIPDKKLPYYMGKSYFDELIKAGIKIYEYTPGFIHSKVMVTDNTTAIVGTINWDFRSLYLHFEDGVIIHGGNTVEDIKFDFERTLNSCHMLVLKDLRNRKWYEKLFARLLKFLAPLF